MIRLCGRCTVSKWRSQIAKDYEQRMHPNTVAGERCGAFWYIRKTSQTNLISLELKSFQIGCKQCRQKVHNAHIPMWCGVLVMCLWYDDVLWYVCDHLKPCIFVLCKNIRKPCSPNRRTEIVLTIIIIAWSSNARPIQRAGKNEYVFRI